MKNMMAEIEVRDQIDVLEKSSHSKLIETILFNQAECFFASGKINKSAVSRLVGIKATEVEPLLKEMRSLIS